MRPTLEVVLFGGVAAVGAAAATWILARVRRSPAERERRRRELISKSGRLIEGMVSDCANGVVYYSYSWRGVDYEASQDISAFAGVVPGQPDALIGLVTVKFLARDASNSIVFSETWSGFPRLKQTGSAPRVSGN